MDIHLLSAKMQFCMLMCVNSTLVYVHGGA